MPEIYLQNLWAVRIGASDTDQGISITQFPCLIGRHPECQRCINDPLISRRHCFFFVQGDEIWIQDLGSSNGTYLNDERIKGGRALHDGDRLRFAHLAFGVRLPRLPNQPAVKPVAKLKNTKILLNPHQVLVVEDNEDAAESLALLLRAWGHEVQVAPNGPAALLAAQERQPDFVLLDLRLPGMDGYQVAQRLRSRPELKNARVVAITGYDAPSDHERYARCGIDHLLTKPVDPDLLKQLMNHPN